MAVSRRRNALFALLTLLGLVLTSLAGGRPASAVVGGSEVPEGKYRWLAAFEDDGFQFCGATIIAQRWALTAAHCVFGDAAPTKPALRVGNVDYTKGRKVPVTRIVISPKYDPDAFSDDVALLRLGRDANVPAVRIARSTDSALWAHGAPVATAGWGSQVPIAGAVPPVDTLMREAPLEVVGDSQCRTDSAPGVQICAAELLKDSCQGDSGGPLFARRNGTVVQVGIVSSGVGCGVPEFPGVYTEIGSPSVRSFIRTVTGV